MLICIIKERVGVKNVKKRRRKNKKEIGGLKIMITYKRNSKNKLYKYSVIRILYYSHTQQND